MSRKKLKRKNVSGSDDKFISYKAVDVTDALQEQGILAAFENDKYGVMIKEAASDGFFTQRDDGTQEPMTITHLIVVKLDKKANEPTWLEKQHIKNELLGPNAEVVELFPSEARRMSGIPEYQTHLWSLSPGARMPLGLVPKNFDERESAMNELLISEEDMKVYVVESNGLFEVFADEEEARRMYSEAGNEMPDNGVVGKIGSVPTENDGAAWTNGAKKKVVKVLAKAEAMNKFSSGEGNTGLEGSVVVDTNGPVTDQDELEDSFGVVDESPQGDEEKVMSKEFIAMGVSQIGKSREDSVKEAVEMVQDDIDSEQAASDELAAMRKKMAASGKVV